MKKTILPFLLLLISCHLIPAICVGQITVTTGASASALATKLLGTGITVLSPTLTCTANANGTFVGTSVLGFDSGIVLTSGSAANTSNAASSNSSVVNAPSYTDASLATLAGGTVHDACVLEFDFRPAGDTVKFNYVFGSEEYTGFVCEFNDVFGFFISGPGYTVPTNIAIVPGTTIPVSVNSINCTVGMPGCTSIGPGSPFCAYYVNNLGGSTIVYDGLTTTLTATALVTPCDTYHLKLGVADFSDMSEDSGVFLEAGSLTSTGIHITPAGLNPGDTAIGSQYCVRGCTPGKIIFSRTVATPSPFVIHYTIGGTAVNGYDYSTIADSAVIAAGSTADTLYINPLLVPPTGPKTLKLYILSYFTCGGTPTIVDSAILTIYDSLTAITGITSICQGATTTLHNSAAGGTWSSGSTAIATIGTATGIVTGVTVGTSAISYSLGLGCSTGTTVTINPIPGPISGPSLVCPGSSITLSDAVGGGAWSSSNTSIATVTGGGVVTGVAVGTTTITYSIGGCLVTKIVTVTSLPLPISGILSVCQFAITPLSDAGGGTWSSSSTGIATVGITGIVTGVSAGTSTITYSIGTGCNSLAVVTVNPAPSAIGGTLHICAGLTTNLTDATTGGTWTSINPPVASIGATTGLVTASSPIVNTTVLITYTAPGGCTATALVTINPLPGSINSATNPATVCGSATTVLTDFSGGGTWTSSNTLIATIGLTTGITGGVSLTGGSVVITYTLPTGCNTTLPLSVLPLPDPITGVRSFCAGAGTTNLFDATPGGYWQSNNTGIAIIDAFSGAVSGGSTGLPGVDTITYTTTCTVSTTVTVNPAPPPITGPASVCVGSAIQLLDAVIGGTWSSSNTALASVGLTTGIVTGGTVTTSGLVTITYTAPSGCSVSTSITIYPAPGPILGNLHVCAGQTTALTDPPTAGTWMSVTTSIAIVTPGPTAGGITTGVIPGTDSIIFTQGATGCTRIAVVTVNSAPGPITPTPSVCIGSCITLSNATTGGTWTSGTLAVATAGLSTGVICGSAAGTSTITYSLGGTCAATAVVTVHALPAAISGTLSACVGATTSLTDAGGAGTWLSSNTAVATIGVITSGTVYGASPGTSVITYTPPTGCSRTAIVTINAVPALYAVTGGGSYCSGSTSTIHIGLDGSTPGVTYTLHIGGATIVGTPLPGTGSALDFGVFPGAGTYTITASAGGCTSTMTGSAIITISAAPTAFTVTGTATICPGNSTPVGLSGSTAGVSYQLFLSGVVVGTMPGTGVAITFGPQSIAGIYTVVGTSTATGCPKAMTGSATITISPTPVISGPTTVCAGASIPESVLPLTGGTWVSGNTSVATVVPTTGLVSGVAGVASGSTATITYTSTAGCTATTVVTVSSAPGAISGPNTVCVGATATEGDIPTGGAWSPTTGTIATVGSLTGIVTGIHVGTITITYSLGSGCTVNKVMTVTPAPGLVTGATGLCLGASTTLGESTPGGTWGSSNTTIAPVSGTGLVTGSAVGTATISYTLGGCTSTAIVTVNPAPGAITGASSVCAGTMLPLGDPTGGGTWTSSNTSVATVDASGKVWTITGGTTIITYSLGGSCVATMTITVHPISPVTGSTGLCVGATSVLSDGTAGGTWTSSNTSVASVASSGLVTGALAGTSVITYTAPGGCQAMVTVTVNTAPSAIFGNLNVCLSSCTLLSDAAGGGTWTSSNTTIATADGTGLVCGTFPGTSTITYSLGFGCTRTAVVTVNPAPPAITGTRQMCVAASTNLSDIATGGVWSSGNTTVATVTTTGTVWGAAPGTSVISYSPPAGCSVSAVVTVNPLPLPVTGAASLCIGTTIPLADAATGGTWASSNTLVATINSSGIVSGAGIGTATILYSLGACPASAVITVNGAPAPISGSTTLCIGSAITLTDPAGGGTWSNDNTAIATISAAGVVSGIDLGTSTISYTAGGCTTTTVVTINSLPVAISGIARICAGSTTTLTDAPDGGTWSSSFPGIAVVDEVTGLVTGMAGGTSAIAYSMGAGCTVTATVTVDALPAPITGITEVCLGYTTPLGDATGGGTWSSTSATIAAISGSGVVSGVSGGPATISYTNSAGCAATRLVTVVAVPAILGVTNMCAFSSTLPLYDSAADGFWTSTLVSVSLSGVVTSYSSGVGTVTYTLPLGCYATTTVTIDPLPGPIEGMSNLCLGSSMALTDTTAGGTWSSSNTMTAPVDAIGFVTGSSAGPATITYTMASGCVATKTVTVDTFPVAGIIAGLPEVCVGSTIVLSDPAAGGVWGLSNISASVFEGYVSGVSPGIDVISYTVSNSCGTVTTSHPVTINPLPFAGLITGLPGVCVSDSIALTDLATGGVWSSSGTGATVADGIVTGVTASVNTINYTVTTSCGVAEVTKTITVNPLPYAGTIGGGIDTICSGITLTLTDAVTGGIWTSSNGHITITGAGILHTVSEGVDTITYSRTNGCGTASASITVAVKTGPIAGVITGSGFICSGSKDTLIASPTGGDWSATNGNATITTIATGVVVTGVSAGADTIIYTIPSECGPAIAILPITVYTINQCDSMTGTPTVVTNGESLRVWPNPNQGVFTVLLSSNTDEPVQLTITSLVGEKVQELHTTTNRNTEIKLNNAAGIYFVTASTATGNYVAKVVFAQ